MRIGSIVLWKQRDFGIIIEVPPPDPHWGVTAVVQWFSGGYIEEITTDDDNLEVICK